MKVDRRKYDKDIMNKMYDIIELIYILNRLTNEFCEEDYPKEYLLDILDEKSLRSSCGRCRRKDRYPIRRDCCHCGKEYGFIDKIIFYLKSLNES